MIRIGQEVEAGPDEALARLVPQLSASAVDLTSRPSREAANALCRSLGFVERETNVYRFTVSDTFKVSDTR